jgi:hypothetical protein
MIQRILLFLSIAALAPTGLLVSDASACGGFGIETAIPFGAECRDFENEPDKRCQTNGWCVEGAWDCTQTCNYIQPFYFVECEDNRSGC